MTGQAVVEALTRLGHQAIPVDPDRELPKKLLELAPDFVWIALHGSTGEDGTVQGLLDWLDFAYNGSGVLASACGMDKVVSKDLLHGAGLPMIPYRVLESADIDPQNCLEALGLPLVVKPHPFFRFEGNNLVCEVPIAPDEAVLGTEIKVPTPDGTVNLKIPAGVRSGQSLRLQGKGWPRPGGERGDQMVRLQLVTPKDLSPAERECYEKLRTYRSFNPRASIEQTRL